MDDSDASIHIPFILLIFIFFLAVSLINLIWQKGYFKSSINVATSTINLKDVITGFGLFVFAEGFLIPNFIWFVSEKLEWTSFNLFQSNSNAIPLILWRSSLSILAGFGACCLAFFGLDKAKQIFLFPQAGHTWVKQLAVGFVAYLTVAPFIFLFSFLLNLILKKMGYIPIEQVGIQELKKITLYPEILYLTVFEIVVLAPLMEEFLFRGLLQSWLKKGLNTTSSIGISALVFSLFHYSTHQGVSNVTLLTCLFLLGCLLGFLFEKQRSLWAPIGLHGIFNLVSVVFVLTP